MKKEVTFPELRALMAKHGLTQQDMADILGNATYHSFGRKLNANEDFLFSEMHKITEYFNSLDNTANVNDIFFDWKFTKVNS